MGYQPMIVNTLKVGILVRFVPKLKLCTRFGYFGIWL